MQICLIVRSERMKIIHNFFFFEDAVLVTGWKSLTLVSLKDGAVLAAHSVPCVSVSPATLGDFSNDGLTDFVVRCEKRCDSD